MYVANGVGLEPLGRGLLFFFAFTEERSLYVRCVPGQDFPSEDVSLGLRLDPWHRSGGVGQADRVVEASVREGLRGCVEQVVTVFDARPTGMTKRQLADGTAGALRRLVWRHAGRIADLVADAPREDDDWTVAAVVAHLLRERIGLRPGSVWPKQEASGLTEGVDGVAGAEARRIVVEALDKEAVYRNFLNLTANIVGGENIDKPQQVRLLQIAPGTYRAEFNASEAGAYVAAINYRGRGAGGADESGMLLTGTVKNGTPEDRALRSDEAQLRRIAERTGGRVLTPFDAATASVFTREGVPPGTSLKPIWDVLLPWLLALIILDVAVRRIAWDYNSLKRMAVAVGDRVRAFTTTRHVEAKPTLDALKKVRDDVAEQRFKPGDQPAQQPGRPPPVPTTASGKPDPKAKFVEGDITQVVGGATNKPLPSVPKKVEPKGAASPGGHLGGLMAAKKRAQQQIKEKEQGEG